MQQGDLKEQTARLLAAQQEKHDELVKSNLEAFRTDLDQGTVTADNNPETGAPVLEWRPPSGWHLAHQETLRQIENQTDLEAAWNGCPTCPVHFRQKDRPAPRPRNFRPLAEAAAEWMARGAGRSRAEMSELADAIESLVEPYVALLVGATAGSRARAGPRCECLGEGAIVQYPFARPP